MEKENYMNIINQSINYTNSKQYSVKNNKAHNNYNSVPVSNNNMQGDSVSFKGMNLRAFGRRFLSSKSAKTEFEDFVGFASGVLKQDKNNVKSLIEGKPDYRLGFFNNLVEKYNAQNFYAKERENPEEVFKLFKRVTFPNKTHQGILNTDLTITEINRCYDILDGKAGKIKSVTDMYYGLSKTHRSKELTMQMMESPNNEEYLKNFEQYKPYIETHAENKDVIKELDNQVRAGLFDKDHARKVNELDKVLVSFSPYGGLTKEDLLPHFSDEGTELIHLIGTKISFRLENLAEGKDKENLINIYKTTNKKNIEARTAFFEAYDNCGIRKNFPENEIESISTLFGKMDENPKVKKFVKNLSKTGTKLSKAEDYMTLMDEVNIDVLNRDVNKIHKIANHWNPSKSVFDFYRTEPHSLTGRFIKSIKSKFIKEPIAEEEPHNEIAFNPSSLTFVRPSTSKLGNRVLPKEVKPEPPKADKTVVPEKPIVIPEIEAKAISTQAETVKPAVSANVSANETLPAVIYHHSALDMKPPYQPVKLPKMEELIAPQNKFRLPEMIVKTAEKPAVEAPDAKTVDKPARTFRHLFKAKLEKQPSAKKLAVISDVNNVIEKKLGRNVYADQSRSYADKATKMRLNMLPEIFESIKETRAAERKAGTFSKTKSVKNEDALGLYRRINGKNRRLVNYMLKVRNEDGTRKYNVRDIVETLDNTNKTVMQAKKSATKENPFRAKDEKALYTALADEQIAKYGKLSQRKTKKS